MLDDITRAILDLVVNKLRETPRLRLWVTGFSSSLFLISLISLTTAKNLFNPPVATIVGNLAPGFAAFSGFVFMLSLMSFTKIKITSSGIAVELDSIHEERRRIEKRLSQQPKPDILDTIQLNLNQLTEYYTINKSQARSSFRFSVFAVIVGFITLVAGIWIFYYKENPNISLAAVTTLSGTLVQFIGAAYFYLYRKSLEQLNFFFHQLVKMQDTMLSIKLCEQISPTEKQMQLREKIILTLLERSSEAKNNIGKVTKLDKKTHTT